MALMTSAQIYARLGEIDLEMKTLAESDEQTDDIRSQFDALAEEVDVLNGDLQRAKKHEAIRSSLNDPARVAAGDNPKTVDRDVFGSEDPQDPNRLSNPFDLDAIRSATPADARARALSAIEEASGFTTRDREILTRWVEDLEDDNPEATKLMRHIVTTSAPDYVKAWKRAFKTGAKTGTPDPQAMGYLARAMSLTDASGGFAVPQQLDPALILTSDGSTNPVRQISRVVQATGDTWTGLSTTHASWSNDAEAAEVSDDATTFAQPSIAIHKAQVFIPFSLEIEMDYPGFSDDLRKVIAGGKDDLDAANFITGSGSGQPTGIVTALTGGGSEIASAGADTFAVGDVYALDEGLPARHRQNANWIAERAIQNDIRQFDTAGGANLWERLGADVPPELLGKPIHEASAMDGTYGSGENYVLVVGDFENYVIADRVGMTLELVPHLFATANNRPSGQRGFYGYARTGADSVNDGAFRMLNVT